MKSVPFASSAASRVLQTRQSGAVRWCVNGVALRAHPRIAPPCEVLKPSAILPVFVPVGVAVVEHLCYRSLLVAVSALGAFLLRQRPCLSQKINHCFSRASRAASSSAAMCNFALPCSTSSCAWTSHISVSCASSSAMRSACCFVSRSHFIR